jgi:hypothetical protein
VGEQDTVASDNRDNDVTIPDHSGGDGVLEVLLLEL